jgi:hypothetical protein
MEETETCSAPQAGWHRDRKTRQFPAGSIAILQTLVVGISGFCRFFYLLARLREQLLRLPRVSAEVVIIVLLRFVNFLPRLLDELLCGPHISVPLSDVYRWLLRKYGSTKDEDRAQGDSRNQGSLNRYFVHGGPRE